MKAMQLELQKQWNPLNLYCESINNDCKLSEKEGRRSVWGNEECVKQIVLDLTGRPGYPSFPEFSGDLIEKLDYRDVYPWMKENF